MYEINTPYAKARIQLVARDPENENSEDVYFVTSIKVETSDSFVNPELKWINDFYSKEDVSSYIAKVTSDILVKRNDMRNKRTSKYTRWLGGAF